MARVNWALVKKETLWDYPSLIQKLEAMLAYPFVLRYYDQTMLQAVEYDRSISHGY
ncbi:MAG: hypothetical protein BWY10_02118 [Chloroflexi bacterium ADurb.Bin180]|nr:MAG: hypothetical protein BWY10_02118 [Chloroflexi bacterium ADurb.Bin180]